MQEVTAAPATVVTATDEELRAALEHGNIPTLLMVVAQLTGDGSWLQEPYRPTRTVAMDDNDTGGLPEVVQDEIRAAALAVIRGVRDGEVPVPAPPSDERLIRMLSFSLGESVPSEYGPSMAEEAGFRARRVTWTGKRPDRAASLRVLVIGAGPSGIAAAIALKQLGVSYTVLERNEGVGGVWRDNTYPGAGVDTPAHIYSYSFAPRRGWSRYYAKQPEVLAYLHGVAREFNVEQDIEFGMEVTAARWDDRAQRWIVTARASDGHSETMHADVVISCVGNLNEPAVPGFPGLELFEGPVFHSARWDHSVDLDGKRVAVIGTGATSMQIVPAIADRAERTLVFQRTPQWVAPNPNYLRDVPAGVRLLMEQVPYYASFYRLRLIWQFQDKALSTLRRDPEWPHPDRAVNATNDRHRAFFTNYVRAELQEDWPRLRDQVVPAYPPYSKRILMDNEWIRTVRRDDVELISEAVAAFDYKHVMTADGQKYEADVVVFATGFHNRRVLWPMHITGRSGVSLSEQWGDDDASAYLGISVPDFPNFFIVGGPHTTLAHGGSAIFISECALTYILQILVRMIEDGLASVEVRGKVADAYNCRVDAEHEQLVWTHPGTTNWYRNKRGRVVSAIPWRAVEYWAMTRRPDLRDYHVRARRPAG